jgi:tryptophanyl-tRNA synthetase
MRERRAAYEADRGYVETLIVEGTARTRDEVVLTVREMRSAMGLTSTWNRIRRRAEDRAKKIGAAG